MKIRERLAAQTPVFSFEFFPPKNQEGVDRLFDTVSALRPFEPAFVSVTYGAGGSTRKLTVDLVCRIKREAGLDTMAHLTCVGATRGDISSVLNQLQAEGIENVLALRGDPPQGSTRFEKVAGGFGYANELTEFIRSRWSFCIAGACYPEVHPEAGSAEVDMDNLKRKVDAGAEFLITQLFFDEQDYFRFIERAQAAGISVPILAGIMPVTNLSQVKRFTAMCGARIPGALLARLEATGGDADAVRTIGVEHAIVQCRALLAQNAPGIHFYTLNRSPATKLIMEALR